MSTIVTVYTKPACPQCTATTRALDKLGIPFSIEGITPSVVEAAMELGIAAVPIVCANVDGVEVEPWGGFRPDRIKALAGAA